MSDEIPNYHCKPDSVPTVELPHPVAEAECLMGVASTDLFALGQHLFTRDGRIVGNAIITEVTPDGLIRVETDFGNGGSFLNTNEVQGWWYAADADGLVRISDVSRWREARMKCQANAERTGSATNSTED